MRIDEIIVLACAMAIPAVPAWPDSDQNGWVAGLVLGQTRFDVDKLDVVLVDNGFNGIESTEFGTGFTAHKLINGKLIIGVEFFGSQQVVFSEGAKAEVNARSSQLNLGYVILEREQARIFPLLGIGNSGVSVQITDRSNAPSFAEVVDRSFRENSVASSGFTITFGVEFDYFLKFGSGGDSRGGVLLGTRVGYAHSPGDPSWKMEDGTDVLGGPEVDGTGPYLRFIVGGGRIGD